MKPGCLGQCDGTGLVAISRRTAYARLSAYTKEWEEAERASPATDRDGYHILICKRCKGTGIDKSQVDDKEKES